MFECLSDSRVDSESRILYFLIAITAVTVNLSPRITWGLNEMNFVSMARRELIVIITYVSPVISNS